MKRIIIAAIVLFTASPSMAQPAPSLEYYQERIRTLDYQAAILTGVKNDLQNQVTELKAQIDARKKQDEAAAKVAPPKNK